MTATTYGDLFGGFGGATVGAVAAGLTPLWSIEYDADIAAVQRANVGDHVIVASVLDVDPAELSPVDVLHMSPPCPNFSVAKAGAKETEGDLALARKCAEFIRAIRPKFVTLENVYGYRKSYSIMVIWYTLLELGYGVDSWHCNFADFGVPQTRKRLIVTASSSGRAPQRPMPSHCKRPNLLERRWVGWYEAIEDLIPALPESKFAPWQLDRLPDELRETVMVKNGDRRAPVANGRTASMTVSATNGARAFVVANGKYGDRITLQTADQPHGTVTSNHNQANLKAFIIRGGNANSARAHNSDEPALTAGDTERVGNIPRAFVVNGTPNDSGATVTVNGESAPIFTQTASQYKRPARAFAGGRVVKMTPRALARFQSFPDWYVLPEKTALACKGIGNAVPPLGYQKLIQQLLEVTA